MVFCLRCFEFKKFKTVKASSNRDVWAFISSWLHFREDVDESPIEPVSPSPVSASVEVGESAVDGPMVAAAMRNAEIPWGINSQVNVGAEASEPTEQGATRKVPRSESC